jgi:hypothetical protein
MLLVMLLLFPSTNLLGHPEYAVRECAQQTLERLWPLSRPAILLARESDDPEIRLRVWRADMEGAKNRFGRHAHVGRGIMDRPGSGDKLLWLLKVQPDLVRWGMVDFALKDPSGNRMLALWLLASPFEENGELPWFPHDLHREFSQDTQLAQALCDLVDATWRDAAGDCLLLGCNPKYKTSQTHYLEGVDNVRFWLRGLPDPQGAAYNSQRLKDMRRLWNLFRDKGLTVPPRPVKM